MKRPLQTMDGNHAAAHVAYAYSEVSAIYPITPSSPMSELMDRWSGQGRKNIFGQTVPVREMQSEAGVAGAVHGALSAGALTTTFTSSQGLLLMIPNLYRMAGEHLPGVIHVAARTIATHALSIFGDHSDIYACRQTGVAIFAASNVQEVMDLTPAVHFSALEGSLPFLNFFDGFRTSHELQKIAVWEDSDLAEMFPYKALEPFRARSLHPDHKRIYGSAQNPDIFFQAREASNPLYDALPGIVEKNLQKINKKLGTSYGLMDYYGAPDATHVILAMGSVCDTVREYLDSLDNYTLPNSSRPGTEVPAQKCGLISLHLYRPFPVQCLLSTLPKTVTKLSVLSRTREPGAPGEPLYLDVAAALGEQPSGKIRLFSGSYGLSSKDTTPAQIAAVYQNDTLKHFSVGILDDVTHRSLSVPSIADTLPAKTMSCKIWGLGGDGTISASKNIVKILGDHTDLQVQGYFEYDSKKSRGLTISHLRFGPSPIRSAYLVEHADFAACHNPVYLHKYQIVEEIKEGGIFLLNCPLPKDQAHSLAEYLPDSAKECLLQRHIRLFVIDALRIGKETGLNGRISTILQAAFFRVTGILPGQKALQLMMDAAEKSYGKLGEKILRINAEAIRRGFEEVTEVSVKEIFGGCLKKESTSPADNHILPCAPDLANYVKNIQQPITDRHGDQLPVSAFLPYADGHIPPGSSAHERRNVTTEIPVWKPENCIQCNRCSYVCPHAVIRPVVMTKEELKKAPRNMPVLPMMGLADHSFSIVVSNVDCTGCGSCAAVCPGRGQDQKALSICPIGAHESHQSWFDYGKSLPEKPRAVAKFGAGTVKGSQFLTPLMEFSGACAGCGETPYVKLLTQLFGPQMYIANATGCSSIWANSAPSTAYTVNHKGQGPAWSNSLFEDAAEFGLGMLMAQQVHGQSTVQWVLGGDGWAYDIGFGGLDHVLSSGCNINILVLDTEVYSNTGGQASKATPLGSTAAFAFEGKSSKKKDLAAMAMTYGNVYVAQVAMGADFNQTVKAFTEAAAYPGPSLVIAYATCIAHGIRAGMGTTPHEEKKAVDAGYFHLFRYNPSLIQEGRNPFCLDSRKPSLDYEDFLSGENRYDLLQRRDPHRAALLFAEAKKQADERYERLQKLVRFYQPDQTS
ncbi:MAG: pyruvate:ferredoxin (flavodoxin) oxidoreductase [Lachnospiraceae bacterium]|nr:pyruvate:ferredoxin (flavodoxin) oxidoreductase [Lachnospiraceae bacterium]